MLDPYDVDAQFYDLIHGEGGADVGLWLSLAGRTDRPVLEIGTGTGRIAVALAAAGHSVRGLDPSRAMLSRARLKANDAGFDIDFEEAGLPDIPAGKGDDYGLVLVPVDVFLHCPDGEGQLAALRRMGSALAFNGRIAIDVPGPAAFIDGLHNGEPVLVYSAPQEDGTLLDVWQVHEDDLAMQTRTLSMRYEMTDAEGNVRRWASEHRLRYVYRFEMEYLLHLAGLQLHGVYGDYDLGELTNESARMVFIAGRQTG